eukprot:scaffold115760_cov65-Attheya_sp.AAC.9
MLGPSALFNTGYRHGANGDGKEPRFHGIGQSQFYMNLPVRRNSRLGYAKKECYDSLETWHVKHRNRKNAMKKRLIWRRPP